MLRNIKTKAVLVLLILGLLPAFYLFRACGEERIKTRVFQGSATRVEGLEKGVLQRAISSDSECSQPATCSMSNSMVSVSCATFSKDSYSDCLASDVVKVTSREEIIYEGPNCTGRMTWKMKKNSNYNCISLCKEETKKSLEVVNETVIIQDGLTDYCWPTSESVSTSTWDAEKCEYVSSSCRRSRHQILLVCGLWSYSGNGCADADWSY